MKKEGNLRKKPPALTGGNHFPQDRPGKADATHCYGPTGSTEKKEDERPPRPPTVPE